MSVYSYKVLDKNNKIRKGQIEGDSINSVSSSFHEQGLVIIDLQEQGFSLDTLKNINIGGIPFKDKVLFIRQLSFMIGAGLSITQALEIAKDQVKNVAFKKILETVLKDVQNGMALSRAMKKHGKTFDSLVINLIKAAEESGNMDVILDRVANDLEKQQEFNGKVKGALIYPVVVMIAILIVLVLMITVMIPQMASIFEASTTELPLPTRIILSISNFLTKGPGGLLTLGGLIFVVVFTWYYRKTPAGRIATDKALLKIPVFGMITDKSQVASFCRTFAMLLTSGVPFLDALKLVSDTTNNVIYRDAILECRKKVEKGVPLSIPLLATKVFPDLVGHMSRVGEETGQMDIIMEKLGVQYSKEVDQIANNLTKLMEPIILIIMGIMVGILAVAVYLPIFNLGSAITGS